MYCTQCGQKSADNDTFCTTCGTALSEQPPSPTTPSSYIAQGTIQCANCTYAGAPENARSTFGQVLAWLTFFLSPLITIIYYLATYKWRCPQCKSTFLRVQNKHGQFIPQKRSNVALLVVVGFIGIAIIGILASVILASLSGARERAQEVALTTKGDTNPESEGAGSFLLAELNPNMEPLGHVTDRAIFDIGRLSSENWRDVITYNTTSTTPAPAQSHMRFPGQQEVFRAVVKIVCEDEEHFYYGSGTNIDGTGYILTNKHVVSDPTPSDCVVGFPDPASGLIKEAYWATPILDDDTLHDLALLSVEQPVVDEEYNVYGSYERYTNGTFPFYKETDACLATSPALGDQVFALGYPYLSGGALTITEGLVSSLYSQDNYIITSAKISQGNSGGLAVDASGCFVGVPSATYWEERAEQYGEIIDARFVYDFYEDIMDEIEAYVGGREISLDETVNTLPAPMVPAQNFEGTTLTPSNTATSPLPNDSGRASGIMFIYNEYSTTPQRLINNTRFQSSSGLIFRSAESVEIPGYTVSNSSLIPGTATVRVYADDLGPTYLIGPGDFSIPGFQGLDQEGKIYGRTHHATSY